MATEGHGNEVRSILAPTGNRVRDLLQQRPTKALPKSPENAAAVTAVERRNDSADSSSDSSSSSASNLKPKSATTMASRRIKKSNCAAKIVPDGVEALTIYPLPVKRCDWITPNSEVVYTCFHDEEWGVPVHDDVKLFELLVFSQALAELSWPLVLTKRLMFRKVFVHFDPMSVANLDEERLLSMRVQGGPLLSEPKIRAVVENAKQLLKIQQEFGSFSNYCWRFVKQKPIKSGFRYARQVPAKTPKSEMISRDLMQRGFRCVGPTVVYSFMQAAGLVNDHLVTCYRYTQCAQSNQTT